MFSGVRKGLAMVALLMIVMWTAVGCEKVMTDEGEKIRLKPDVAAGIDTALEGGATGAAAGSVFFPWLAPVATALGAAGAVWKKMRGKVVATQKESEAYHTAGMVTTTALEEFKEVYPNEWAKLEVLLAASAEKIVSKEDALKIENLIRGMRGLPAKT
ncbi:MAG: hypothetical protein ACXABY_14195 [Candidatus Thorarchaeota archaeon]|jgi:hypothetical protein